MHSFWVSLIALALCVFITSAQLTTDDPSTTIYKCDVVDNCSARGHCITDDEDGSWYCLCAEEYTTHPAVDEDTPAEERVYCNYKQKSQLTAFLLSWFLGEVGGGQWYLGLNALAGAKLGFTLAMCCCACCWNAAREGDDDERAPIVAAGCCACCGLCGVFTWWLVDIIRFSMNWYKDENGVFPYEM